MTTKQAARPPEVTRGHVVNALYELAGKNGGWPTLAELAYHMGMPPVQVHERLNELIVARLFHERRVDGRQVWVPWD